MSPLARTSSAIVPHLFVREGKEVIEEYLECLVAPLVGVIPFTERARLREETAFHLERLHDDYRQQGLTSMEAALQAVSDYGPSQRVATEFLDSWFRKSSDSTLSRRFGHGNVIAFTAFALCQVLCTAVFQMRVYLPSQSAWNFAIRPAAFNEVFPPSLPVPEFTPLYAAMLVAVFGSPLLAGAIVGRLVAASIGSTSQRVGKRSSSRLAESSLCSPVSSWLCGCLVKKIDYGGTKIRRAQRSPNRP